MSKVCDGLVEDILVGLASTGFHVHRFPSRLAGFALCDYSWPFGELRIFSLGLFAVLFAGLGCVGLLIRGKRGISSLQKRQ